MGVPLPWSRLQRCVLSCDVEFRGKRLAAVVSVVVPTVLAGLHALAYGRWIVDDAAITFAYARSIATGAGPVLQPGGPEVEGWSNPSWLAVHVVGRWLGLFDHGSWFGVPDYVTFPKMIALLCCAGMFAAMRVAAGVLGRHPSLITLVAGSVTSLVPSFVIWCFSGLENSMLALAVVGIAAVLARAVATDRLLTPATAVSAGLLAALAALTRPDGLIYLTAFPLVALLFVTRQRLRASVGMAALAVAVALVPFGLYLLWRVLTFHALVPNTALAKAQGVPSPVDLAKSADLLAYFGWALVLVGVVAVGAVLIRPSRVRAALTAVVVPLGLAVIAFGVLLPDWMGQFRFATPVWPLAALATTAAVAAVLPVLAVRGRVVLAVATALALVLSGSSWEQQLSGFRAAPTVPVCLVAQVSGREFNDYADALRVPGGTVLLPDVGGSALVSRLRVVDLAGLADREIAVFWRDGDMAGLRDLVFDEVKPTFLHAHGYWADRTGVLVDTRLSRDYVLLKSNPVEGENWVRRDVVPDAAALDAARLAGVRAQAERVARDAAPRGSCGDLVVGGRTGSG